MEIPKTKRQSPFRQSTLLTSSSFISHCDKQNVRIRKEQLERWHREGLLYPALRLFIRPVELIRIFTHHQGAEQWVWVYRGDVGKFQFTKSEKRPYYELESLWMGSDDWLDQWHQDQYDFPSTKRYFPWKERYHGGYVRSKKLLSQSYELLYDKRQLLAVKIIVQHEKDVRMFPKEERYIRTRLRQKLSEFYAFLSLYIAIEELEVRSAARIRKYFNESLKQQQNRREAQAETKSFYKLTEQPRLEDEVKDLISLHNLTAKQLSNWRFWLGQQSHLNEGSIFRESSRVYLAHLTDAVLVKAEDTNKMVRVLNWFLYFLTGEAETVQGIVGGWIGPHCRFCRRAYIPRPNRRADQQTCGRKECSDILRNLNRKPKRRKKTI